MQGENEARNDGAGCLCGYELFLYVCVQAEPCAVVTGDFGEGPEVLGVLLQATCCLQAGGWSWGGLRKQAWLRKQARTIIVVMLAQQDQLCSFVAVHLQLLVQQKYSEKHM